MCLRELLWHAFESVLRPGEPLVQSVAAQVAAGHEVLRHHPGALPGCVIRLRADEHPPARLARDPVVGYLDGKLLQVHDHHHRPCRARSRDPDGPLRVLSTAREGAAARHTRARAAPLVIECARRLPALDLDRRGAPPRPPPPPPRPPDASDAPRPLTVSTSAPSRQRRTTRRVWATRSRTSRSTSTSACRRPSRSSWRARRPFFSASRAPSLPRDLQPRSPGTLRSRMRSRPRGSTRCWSSA